MIAEKLRRVADNLPLLYEAGKKICEGKHFSAVVMGDGTEQLVFHLPFEPDILSITGFEPNAYKKDNVVAHLHANLASFAYVAGASSSYITSGSLASTGMTSESILTRYERQADGTVTIKNVRGSTADKVGFFQKDMPYVVVAVQYEKKPIRERIEDYVQSLTGSGTASLNRRKVFEVFTQEQWNELIATRPGWTFTLF